MQQLVASSIAAAHDSSSARSASPEVVSQLSELKAELKTDGADTTAVSRSRNETF